MASAGAREIWFHALGAKVGGGITYLRAVLPEFDARLGAHGDTRVVLLLPAPLDVELSPRFEVRILPDAARSAASRLRFDQVTLPAMLGGRKDAVLFCSGSFSPVFPRVPSVALLRNAIYFDADYLARETPSRRRSYALQGRLIAAGASRAAAVVYPSLSMRELVEESHPALASRGHVDHYGVAPQFLEAGREAAPPARSEVTTFLYVMTYTLQKNFGYLLEALAAARREQLPVRALVTTTLDGGAPASFASDMRIVEENDLVGSGYLEPVGPVYGDALVDLYRSVDACVFPSICESFGHPLVEAMAMGRPLVAADKPYARELCGEHAIYVDAERPEALVDVWRRWREHEAGLVRAPLDALAERFSWRSHVARLVEILENV
jgi:glycosyltransferase involved in cell wall biosynthesis